MEILSYLFDYQLWIGFFFGLIVLWYIYYTWDYDYWTKQGIPGEKPQLFIGTLKPTWKHSIQDQDMEGMKKYGHVHGGFVGALPTLFVSDPELLRQILVKDFAAFPNRTVFKATEKDKIMGNMLSVMKGDKWKMVRNTLSPTYTSGKLKQMVGLIEECLQNLTANLKTSAEKGEPIEFTKKFSVLTLDIIAKVAFGMKVNCIDNPDTEFVVKAQKAFRGNAKLFYIVFIFAFFFKWFPSFMIASPFKYFATVANQSIDMRLKNKNFVGKDVLQIMLDAEIPNDETDHVQSTGPKKTLTRDIIVAQSILFILAGHETTATTLNFMAYELAINQDMQDILIKEVDDVMMDSKGKLSYEGVASMRYLDMVTSETLRKYPPAVRLDRVCSEEEYKLNGINIRKGMSIAVPVYAIHHNSEFYPNPSVFDPERFTPEMKAQRNPFTYLPFGEGPRNCIAKRFALLEAKLVMVHMLYNYRFQTCGETEYPVKMLKGTGFLQPESMKLVLQKRVDQPHFEETV